MKELQIVASDEVPDGGVIFVGDIAAYMYDNKIESVAEFVQLLKDRPEDAKRLFSYVKNLNKENDK